MTENGRKTRARRRKLNDPLRKPHRKKGRATIVATEVTAQVIEQSHSRGMTPLQVMLAVMEIEFEAKRYMNAAAVAKDAAYYVHPRLMAVQHQEVNAKTPEAPTSLQITFVRASHKELEQVPKIIEDKPDITETVSFEEKELKRLTKNRPEDYADSRMFTQKIRSKSFDGVIPPEVQIMRSANSVKSIIESELMKDDEDEE